MTGRTHDLIGFAAFLTAGVLVPSLSLNIETLAVSVVGNVVGSLIPDVDQATNKLWDMLPVGNIVGKFGRKAFYKHRTITHSLLGGFLLFKFLVFIIPKIFNPNYINPQIVLVSIMIGFVMHLIADSITREGLPLFFPLKFKIGFPPIEALRIPTGGIIEHFIVFPSTAIYIVWLLINNKEKVLTIAKLLHK